MFEKAFLPSYMNLSLEFQIIDGQESNCFTVASASFVLTFLCFRDSHQRHCRGKYVKEEENKRGAKCQTSM